MGPELVRSEKWFGSIARFPDKASNVRNVVFLKHYIMMQVFNMLKIYFAETREITSDLTWIMIKPQLNSKISPGFNCLSFALATSSNISDEHFIFEQNELSSSVSQYPWLCSSPYSRRKIWVWCCKSHLHSTAFVCPSGTAAVKLTLTTDHTHTDIVSFSLYISLTLVQLISGK